MSVGTELKRIFRNGFVGLGRNSLISFTTVMTMATVLMLIGSMLILNSVSDFLVKKVSANVDVNVYIDPSADKTDTAKLKLMIEGIPEIDSVSFKSKDEVYNEFRERYSGDPVIMQSLDELNTNPFGDILTLRAKDTVSYESIVPIVEKYGGQISENLIEDINYYDNAQTIESLTKTVENIKSFIFYAIVFFIIIAILVAFGTFRLSIHSLRDEIEIMRLVGARKYQIKGPFFVQGLIYGIISSALATGAFYFILKNLGEKSESLLSGYNVFEYFVMNSLDIFIVLSAFGIFMGIISSLIAVKKYAEI